MRMVTKRAYNSDILSRDMKKDTYSTNKLSFFTLVIAHQGEKWKNAHGLFWWTVRFYRFLPKLVEFSPFFFQLFIERRLFHGRNFLCLILRWIEIECFSPAIMLINVLVSRKAINFCLIFMSDSFQFYCDNRLIFYFTAISALKLSCPHLKLMSSKRKVRENLFPTWKIPSGQMARMGMACCTPLGTTNLSLSCFMIFCRVLITAFPCLLFVVFQGGFQGFVIDVGRMKD